MLTNAVYGESAALNTGTLKYDETFTYDKSGNTLTLKRYGLKDNNTFGLIDDLSVTQFLGNKVRKVLDAAGNQASADVMEFKKTYTSSGEEYIYGGIGALIADYNRNICMFKYNYLSLPQSVQFRRGDRIEYIYDAAGVKRQTTHKVTIQDKNYSYYSTNEPAPTDFDATKTVTTQYYGNKIYVNNQLKYILTEEGYIEKSGSTYTAYYYLNDHLGGRRVVMDASGTVKQVNNYYPSGTTMAESPRRTDQDFQPYKFTGKELDRFDTMNFYDFEARTYDPTLMRFTGIDPLAEKYPSISPYVFCLNNPVLYIDPNGMDNYRYDDKTGQFTLMGANKDKTDKVMAYHQDKKTGEWKQNDKWYQTKTRMDNIEKGILSNGINFKENNNVIDVGGESQASVAGVENFLLDFSNMIDKELGGYYLSDKGSNDINHIYVGKFKNNSSQEAKGGFNPYRSRPDLFNNIDVKVSFHTHLSRFGDSDRLRPSSLGGNGGDLGNKDRELKKNPLLKFLIITNPKPFYY